MGISPTSIKVTALGGLLALGTGLGIASANAETTPSPSTSTSVSSGSQAANSGTGTATATPGGAQGDRGPGGPGGKGKGMRGIDAASLASKLGVDEAKVTAALAKVHEALRPAAPNADSGSTQSAPTPPTAAEIAAREKAFAAALAKELGVSEAKVTTALTEIRAAHQAEHKAALSTRLDAAVTAGTITASDKASVLKAFDAGVLGGPGGPRG